MTAETQPLAAATALAIRQSEAIVPLTFADAQNFSLEISKSGLIPAALRAKAADCLVIVLAGRELGIPPMAALRLFQVGQDGTPRLTSDGLVAVVLQRGVAQYFEPIEESEKQAIWATKRIGGLAERRYTFTWDQATRAGLVNKETYKKYPAQLLSQRCKAFLARTIYPDVVGGLYTPDEDLTDLLIERSGAVTSAGGFVAPPPAAAQPAATAPAPAAAPPPKAAPKAKPVEAAKPAPPPPAPPPVAPAPEDTVLDAEEVPAGSTDMSGFGDETPVSTSGDPDEIVRFRAALFAAKTIDDLNAAKKVVLSWSRTPAAAAFVDELKTTFAAAKAALEAAK